MITDILTLLYERKDFFLELVWQHLEISFIAIGMAMVIGLLLGIMVSEYEKTTKISLGIINFIYTIPSISLLGFLIPFSGIGNTTAIIALTIYALLPMVRNTYTGFTNVDTIILEAAEGMGSTRWQLLVKIKLPLAFPVIMSGIRNMVTMTIALTGIASFIGAGGLGVAIYRGITTNHAVMTLAGSLLIALLAVVIDFLLGLLEQFIKNKRQLQPKAKRLVIGLVLMVGIVLFGSQFFKASQENIIRIGTKPMTEQLIIGELLKLFIEQETDLYVELTQGIGGGTANIMPAMKNEELDLYPEYTGTGWNIVLGEASFYHEGLFASMQEQFQDLLRMTWIGMYGFDNTYGLAVRSEVAEAYNLVTFSDLAAVSDQLVFGAEYDFYEREDGYQWLLDQYGFNFRKRMDLDIGLKYQAINEGQMDVMTIFTTDGQLTSSEVVILEDDLQVYPSYLAGNIIRMELLERHPELYEVFSQLEGVLNNETMSRLNDQVEVKGEKPREVAVSFLQEVNLLQEGGNLND